MFAVYVVLFFSFITEKSYGLFATLLFALSSLGAGFTDDRIRISSASKRRPRALLKCCDTSNRLAEHRHHVSRMKHKSLPMMSSDQRLGPIIPAAGELAIPIGQLALCRSPALEEYNGQSRLEQLNRIARLASRASKSDNKFSVLALADAIEKEMMTMREELSRVQRTNDFQSRELHMIMELSFRKRGWGSPESHVNLVRSLVNQLRAQAQSLVSSPSPAVFNESDVDAPGVSETDGIDMVFTGNEKIWMSDSVRAEYQKLQRDHEELICSGVQYGCMESLGKIAFLDQLESIEGRWDAFFGRLALTGDHREFQQQVTLKLAPSGETPLEHRRLVAEVHKKLRNDAEKELPETSTR